MTHLRSRSLIRTRRRERGGMWWHSSILTTGWVLHLLPGPLSLCGGVPIWKRGPVHQVHSSRTTSFAHTSTIESAWWQVKAFLNRYNEMRDYIYHLAHFMFAAVCRSDNVDQFTKSIGIVASIDHMLQPWSRVPLLSTIAVMSLRISPSPHSPLRIIVIYNPSVWVAHITTDNVLLCSQTQLKLRTTVPRTKGVLNKLLRGICCI